LLYLNNCCQNPCRDDNVPSYAYATPVP
jgi:hypothetical protein